MTSSRSLPARPRRTAAFFAAALLTVGVAGVASPAAAAPPEKTPVIVQLTPGSDPAAESRRAAANGGSVSHVYRHAFRGFAGEFTAQAIAALEQNPRVVSVEADGVASTSAAGRQEAPVWGLDRIDEADLALDGYFAYPADGGGVTAYVIDTGIDASTDVDGRLGSGHNTVPGADGAVEPANTGDCNGHGTHVAGTIGGTNYGVAKQVTLVPVRVLNCDGSGTWSGVIAGIDWVVGAHESGPAVANLSLGGSRNSSVDTAVKNLVADGVTVAVAAGNSGRDACNFSPARVPEALTVGATDNTDQRASFSNYGPCLDLFAPGVKITSGWLDGATNTISGTSMASPHVAGAAAVVLSQSAGLSPAGVAAQLDLVATRGAVGSAGKKSPNELLLVTAIREVSTDTADTADATSTPGPGKSGTSSGGAGSK